jgi:hypothetical protein
MEDVLDLYEEPYDSNKPLICFETSCLTRWWPKSAFPCQPSPASRHATTTTTSARARPTCLRFSNRRGAFGVSPEHAGKSTATLASWYVDDVEGVVDELTERGVVFERYDEGPIITDEKGIAAFEGGAIGSLLQRPGRQHPLDRSSAALLTTLRYRPGLARSLIHPSA